MDFLLHHMVNSSARRYPDKTALIHEKETLAYAELASLIENFGSTLQALGCRRQDRVGISLDLCFEQAVSIFGTSRAGAVFVPMNHLLLIDQVCHIANDCQIAGLVVSKEKFDILNGSWKRIPSLRFLIVVGEGEETISGFGGEWMMYHQAIQNRGLPHTEDTCIEKDLAGILYTSGSTGKPKGVMISHAQILDGSSIVSAYLGINETDRIMAVLPFSFDAGLNQIMTAFQQSATLVLKTFVFARQIVQTLQDMKITGLAGVPTLWNLISQPSSGLHKTDLPSLRYITNTGGVMPQKVLTILRQNLPSTNIFLMYGLTEAFRSTYLPPEELDARPTSMGKAIPNTEILVVTEQGRPAQPGEVGELVHRGPTVSLGYWGQPALTNKVLRPHPFLPPDQCGNEKVCFSGDLVTMDEDGFCYFVGRRDSMIKSAGFRLSRTEVEEVIHQSGLVKEVAVIGIPDEILGQAVKAFVVLEEENGGQDKIAAICVEKLPRYMVPKYYEIVTEIPKTPNQKIDYSALQTQQTIKA